MMIGTRLGQYEVLAPLGAGGMGEVYRARDAELKRDVALKVLPADVAADPDRLARFDREAQALAALNYPHIAQVYGVVHDGGVCAIVMGLVEGQTLAERIALRPVSLDEALPIGLQLAEALEYAHERGIIHRDLKPANIKLTPDGAVKVLDSGLAKALGVPGSEDPGLHRDPGDLPTMTSPVRSLPGVILGAAVDKRADIWAFGVVLFEMLTGRACDARLEIEGPANADTSAQLRKDGHRWGWRLAAVLVGVAFVAAAGTVLLTWAPDGRTLVFGLASSGRPHIYRLTVDETAPPERLTWSPWTQSPSSMSPDGKLLVFVELRQEPARDLFLLDMQSRKATP